VALAECCVAGQIGAHVAVPDGIDPFAEAPGRGYVVSGPGEVVANLGLVIGHVGGERLVLDGILEVAVSEMAEARGGGLRRFV
jgi:hypothetical protein